MYCRECGTELPNNAKFCSACGAPVAFVPASVSQGAVPDPTAKTNRKKRTPFRTFLLAFLWFILFFLFQVFGYVVGMELPLPLSADVLSLVFGAFGACLGVACMGGADLIRPRAALLLDAVKQGWWAILVSVGLMIYEIVATIAMGEPVVEEGWLGRFVEVFVMCVAIGIAEEAVFRGLLLSGLLGFRGNSRKGIFAVVVVTSIVFGIAHIDWAGLDYADPLSLVQALLKVLQTGTYGFFLAALTIKSKSVLGPAFIHGLDDFVLMVPSMVLLNGSMDVEYISTGEEAVATIVLYVIFTVLYVPLVIRGKKLLDNEPVPYYGAFMK